MGNCIRKKVINGAITDTTEPVESVIGQPVPDVHQEIWEKTVNLARESPTVKTGLDELTSEIEQLRERIRILEATQADTIEQLVEKHLKEKLTACLPMTPTTTKLPALTNVEESPLLKDKVKQLANLQSPDDLEDTSTESPKTVKKANALLIENGVTPLVARTGTPPKLNSVRRDAQSEGARPLPSTSLKTPVVNKQSSPTRTSPTVNEPDMISLTEQTQESITTLTAASMSSESEIDSFQELYRTNRDERPVRPLPTPIRLNQVSPSTLESFVDHAGRPQRKKISRMMELRKDEA